MARVRKRGRRGSRRAARITTAVTLIVLLLAAIGTGAYLLFGKERYPMDYQDLIRSYAARNDLEPAYVAAVIKAESGFRPQVRSKGDDAQGLMQVLPSTARDDVAKMLGETYAEGSLFDPETNIRYGCRYLRWLMDQYGDDKMTASAGYHAGPGAVRGWLRDERYSADGRTLSAIPEDKPKTNDYVKKVMKYYAKYRELYGS